MVEKQLKSLPVLTRTSTSKTGKAKSTKPISTTSHQQSDSNNVEEVSKATEVNLIKTSA